MSNFQYAIDNATSIQLSYQEITNGIVARNGNITSGRVFGTRPYTITTTMPPVMDGLDTDVRGLISYIDKNAFVTRETIDIGISNPNLEYILRYQGNASTAVLDALEESAFGRPGKANTQILSPPGGTGTPSTQILSLEVKSANSYLIDPAFVFFKPGDFIQMNNTRELPYQVTSTVTGADFYPAGTGQIVDIPINRPYNDQGQGAWAYPQLKVGANVNFKVRLLNKPRIDFIPGGPNNVFARVNDTLEFVEDLTYG